MSMEFKSQKTPFHVSALADMVVSFLTDAPGEGFGLTLTEQQEQRIRSMPYDSLLRAVLEIVEKKDMLMIQNDSELVLAEIGLGVDALQKTQHDDDDGSRRDDGGLDSQLRP